MSTYKFLWDFIFANISLSEVFIKLYTVQHKTLTKLLHFDKRNTGKLDALDTQLLQRGLDQFDYHYA